MYQHGFGTEKDDQSATAWYLKSRQQVMPAADYALGALSYNIAGAEQATLYFKQAALQNNREGQYMMGFLYDSGTGVKQNKELAKQFYEKAADQGMPQALYNLGYMYYMGQGVTKDVVKAFSYFKKGEKDCAKCQSMLGIIYTLGLNGVEVDKKKGFDYFTAATTTQQDLAIAQYNLGIMYYNGWGTPSDEKNAILWISKAADQGLPRAEYFQGYLVYNGIGQAQNLAQAIELYSKAADHGLVDAQFAAATLYHNGEGVEKDEQKAAVWYEAAAKQGLAKAQYMIGLFYQQGWGVLPDQAIAANWYKQAAEQGVDTAQLALAAMYTNGTGVVQDDTQAYVWLSLAATSSNPQVHDMAVSALNTLSRVMQPAAIETAKELAKKYFVKYAMKH
jgi:TPR repeat protein